MSIIRYRTGEVRLVWRLVTAIVLFVAIAVLLRFIPISLYTAQLANSGVLREDALQRAKETIFEGPIWSTGLGIVNGLASLPLIWFLMRVFEGRRLELRAVGLDWRHNSFWNLGLGILLALVMFVASKVAGQAFGTPILTWDTALAGVTSLTIVRKLALYLSMGFGEEVVFRGYMQTRLVERYGPIWGILTASVVFTLVHLGSIQMSPVVVVSGVILWVSIGTLYHWSKSLYLVGMFHGTANSLLNIFSFEGSDLGGLLVHSLVLLIVVAIALRRSRASSARSNPV